MKRTVILLLLLLAVVGARTAPAARPGDESRPAPLFRTIGPAAAKQLIDSRRDLLLVDIRNPDELEQGYIQGSTLIPLWEIVKGRKSLPRDRAILLICAVGGRSLALGRLMSRYGWPEVYNLKGGIAAWKEAGLPLRY